MFNGDIGSPVARIDSECASSVILLACLQRVCFSKGMPALHAHAVCGTSVKQGKMLSAYIIAPCPHYVEASGCLQPQVDETLLAIMCVDVCCVDVECDVCVID